MEAEDASAGAMESTVIRSRQRGEYRKEIIGAYLCAKYFSIVIDLKGDVPNVPRNGMICKLQQIANKYTALISASSQE